MLDQLVESRSDRRVSGSRRGFLALTSALAMILCSGVFVWSIMAMELSLTGSDKLELSTLVAPVPVPAAEPQKPEPVQPRAQQQQQQSAKNEEPMRRENMARTDEVNHVPETVSTARNTSMARPHGNFKIGPDNVDGTSAAHERGNSGEGIGINTGQGNNAKAEENDTKEIPPPVMKAPEREVKKVTMVHSNIINGKATSLPKPVYSAAAVAVNAAGDVNVQVVLDEAGNVISAKAVSGHALLKQAAETAARRAKFSPTMLNGQAVKVTGLIVYKFTRN